MKKFGLLFLMVLFTICLTSDSQTSFEELKLEAKMDEPLEYTLNKRFSLNDALFRLSQMGESHKKVIDLIKKQGSGIPEKEINGLTFSLDFEWVNWPNSIEGTLKKQDYVIAKLQYDLSMERYESEKITKEELTAAEKKYAQSKDNFEKFFNSFRIID